MRPMRRNRLERVCHKLRAADVGDFILYDPINVRYVTGSHNMTLWAMHNAAQHCFISAERPIVLFKYKDANHLNAGLEGVEEIHPTKSW